MGQQIYTFQIESDWRLINQLSQIDHFGGYWTAIERQERQTLKHLKFIATVRSVGASTRIEGSKMTDDEIDVMLSDLDSSKLEDRDSQEVAGYFAALDLISESFKDIEITESNILHLHNQLMKHSQKDAWHKGKYKQHPNAVEATGADGKKYIVFKTIDPGFATDDAMRNLMEWHHAETEIHPIVMSAAFVYEFLTIHPFQDGNGRLSRLLTTLLLLRNGYSWIEYVSFEHEIESRKAEYYKVLRSCQHERSEGNIQPWVMFFLDCLINIQGQLMKKIDIQNTESSISPREKKIYQFINNHPGVRSGEIAEKLDIPLPTVKRILSNMLTAKLLQKNGIGRATGYTVHS